MKTYVLYDPLRQWVKVGRSVDVRARARRVAAASGASLTVLGAVEGDREGEIHRLLGGRDRMQGEWFAASEWVRQVVADMFGVEIPPPPRPQAIDLLEREWDIPLERPEEQWFLDLLTWLTDEMGLEVAPVVTEFYDDWSEWVIAVGGEPETSLGLVLVDRPRPVQLDRDLREWFWLVDGYVTTHIAVASNPPQSLVEEIIEMSRRAA